MHGLCASQMEDGWMDKEFNHSLQEDRPQALSANIRWNGMIYKSF